MTGIPRPFQKFPVDPMLDYMMARAETPRSYIIQTETGGQLRRNRQDVLVPQQPEKPDSEEFSNPEASNDLEVQPAQTKF